MMAPHVKVSVLCPGWVRTRIADSDTEPARGMPERRSRRIAAMARTCSTPLIDKGMSADEVAGKVLAAIRAEQFWILPHDAPGNFWTEFVNERTQSLADRTNPVMRSPLTGS